MITMKEIAKEVGTSQATVSRVLNGNISVNPEIRNRVMECVKKHDYQPNMLAQSLAANKSLLIGVIIPDISNPFFSDLVKNIESEAMKYGYSIILCNTNGSLHKEKYYINILRSYKVDGIIMIPRNTKDKFFINLKDDTIPIIIVTIFVDGYDCISVSHYDSGRDVARHLLENGFTKFAFVGYGGDDKEKGFKQELQDTGYHLHDDYTFIDFARKNSINEKLLPLIHHSKLKKGLGIFALNDVVALIVLDSLKENNIKVPEEVGLIGFDNTFIGKEVSPSISSVSQPMDEFGKQSVEMLIERIINKDVLEKKQILLEAEIVARTSTIR